MQIEIIPKHSHGYLSKHVSASELHCCCDNPTCYATLYCPHVLEQFEKLREECGDQVIRILSGYRCEPHNRFVGGTKTSRHKLSLALDLYCPENTDLIQFGKFAWRYFDYVQVYRDRRFIHCHINPWSEIL